MDDTPLSTDDAAYAERLHRLSDVWWKRMLDVQRPYRWHMRSLQLGFVLDVGCGIGRNLVNLGGAGAGVGVDRNVEAINRCRLRGLTAFGPTEFRASVFAREHRFDSLLLSHVTEHMRFHDACALINEYLPFLKPGGLVVLIAPQEAGQKSDPTHVEFMNLPSLHRLARTCGLRPERHYSFPFPRAIGRWFRHNESVVLARKP